MWVIKPEQQQSASQEAFRSFHFTVKEHNHHKTWSQESTGSCIALCSSAAVTGWPADGGFLCDRAAV